MTEWYGRLPEKRGDRVVAVDTHTEGELTRIVLQGGPELPDFPAAELRSFFATHLDKWRKMLAWEPRGHRDLEIAWLAPSNDSEIDFRLIFMDARRYPLACGTATIGAVVAAVELGIVENGKEWIKVDTPSGLIACHLKRKDGRPTVALQMVPACLTLRDETLQLDHKTYRADLGFVGGFLLLMEADQLDFPLDSRFSQQIVNLGESLISAANLQWNVLHPKSGEAASVDGVVFYDSSGHADKEGRGAVVYGEAHLDRSPCGTGTTVKMALLERQGLLRPGQRFVNRSLLDTSFTGYLQELVKVGDFPGVQVSLEGTAHLVAFHEFFIDPADPLSGGFLLGNPTHHVKRNSE